jgi:hypothetical protein
MPVVDGVEPPPGYVVKTYGHTPVVVGGLVLWIASYGAGLGYAASNGFEQGSAWMVAPVVGPWAAIASRDFGCPGVTGQVSSSAVNECVGNAVSEVETITLLAVDGLFQGVGMTLFIVGLATRHDMWVRADLGPVTLAPGPIGIGGYGLHV